VLRFADGKIVEGHEYCDTELITAAFRDQERLNAL
jgi:ketosteroid isomerase-like protein